MATFVWRDGRFVPKADAAPLHVSAPSHLPCPMIVADHMAPVQGMHDGRTYDSKSSLRASYRANGLTHVATEPARHRPRPAPRTDRMAVKDTIERAAARFERGERAV